MKEVTLVFDIGKTNKKLLLFDNELQVVHQTSIELPEIMDDDGYPAEDIDTLENWILESVQEVRSQKHFRITGINFSTYGASLVCLNEKGERCAPFYNYLKPLPEGFEAKFFDLYGDQKEFELETSSPFLGMLNSGLQLFYLKHFKPEIFKNVRTVMHLPQYLSTLLGAEKTVDYSSLGCHTGMWNFQEKSYASWFVKEGFSSLFPPITKRAFTNDNGERIGIGIHDSTASCLPYLKGFSEPFILISTGTWSIAMNPYDSRVLTSQDFAKDVVVFMAPNGQPIKASRLLLGLHFQKSVERLQQYFNVAEDTFKSTVYDIGLKDLRDNSNQLLFDHAPLEPERFGFVNGGADGFNRCDSFEAAYHQFIFELVAIQMASIQAIMDQERTTFFIDGGFAKNDVFLQVLAQKLAPQSLFKASNSIGSAFGACLMVSNKEVTQEDFFNVYGIERINC